DARGLGVWNDVERLLVRTQGSVRLIQALVRTAGEKEREKSSFASDGDAACLLERRERFVVAIMREQQLAGSYPRIRTARRIGEQRVKPCHRSLERLHL